MGSQHAGGLFSAGEAASGAAFVGAFADRMGEITALARSAEIEYLTLAKGAITASATLGQDKGELIEKLDEDGQAVARMSVAWHVRQDS